MVTIGTQYIIRPYSNEIDVQPGLLRGWGPDGVCNLISAITPTINTVVYIEAQVGESFGVLTASPTIYYKPAGSDTAYQIESLPADIKAKLSNLR